ncbi:MAG: hypothetical protein ACLSHR_11565 [Oscillospiraceae bacterium]
MGYLSQKKKHARINFLLNTSLSIISITSFLALFDRSSGFSAFINQWQFQIYIYLLFVFFYRSWPTGFVQALFACLLIVVNYVMVPPAPIYLKTSKTTRAAAFSHPLPKPHPETAKPYYSRLGRNAPTLLRSTVPGCRGLI